LSNGFPALSWGTLANAFILFLLTGPVQTPLHIHAVFMSFFMQNHWYIHPWQAFLGDLREFISQCQALGDAILLLADMNGDICHHLLVEFFQGCQLHELILSKFPYLSPPATFQ